jgi:hypothetical protein
LDLGVACQYLDEIYLRETIDEGWEAIWIVGCGPDRCRRDKICDLPVEEWGEAVLGWRRCLRRCPRRRREPLSHLRCRDGRTALLIAMTDTDCENSPTG